MPDRRSASMSRRAPNRDRGLVLLALLIALALGGIALMAASEVWSVQRQREREQELLFVGDQYRQAIQRYYFGAPSAATRTLPARLEDLLEDERYPVPVRYLRRLYRDPITGSTDWGLLRSGDRIAGVYSRSEQAPLKQAGFAPDYQHFNGKASYRDWVFAVSPAAGGPPAAGPAPAAATAGAARSPASSRPTGQDPS